MHPHMDEIFNQLGWRVPGFLKLISYGCRYACVSVCVRPRAIKNHSREMKPE